MVFFWSSLYCSSTRRRCILVGRGDRHHKVLTDTIVLSIYQVRDFCTDPEFRTETTSNQHTEPGKNSEETRNQRTHIIPLPLSRMKCPTNTPNLFYFVCLISHRSCKVHELFTLNTNDNQEHLLQTDIPIIRVKFHFSFEKLLTQSRLGVLFMLNLNSFRVSVSSLPKEKVTLPDESLVDLLRLLLKLLKSRIRYE